MKDFLVGAQLYSIRRLMQDKESIDKTFKAIKAMGYTTLQLSGQNREIESEFYADKLNEYGLKCVVTHNSLKDFEEGLDELVKRHHLWNTVYAGLGAMPNEYRADLAGWKAFAKKANEFALKLKDHGLVFVYHNHAFEFNHSEGSMGMDVLFDEFGENVQFELDSYWVQAGGANPVDWIRKVNGRMDVTHFKDMRGCADFSPVQTMVPIGQGNLNWAAIKAACEETGVKYAEVEQDNASDMDDPLGQLEISAKYLKKQGFLL